MEWQYLITGIILLMTIIIAGLKIRKFFNDPSRKCNGCISSCEGCAIEDLKNEIENAKKKKK